MYHDDRNTTVAGMPFRVRSRLPNAPCVTRQVTPVPVVTWSGPPFVDLLPSEVLKCDHEINLIRTGVVRTGVIDAVHGRAG